MSKTTMKARCLEEAYDDENQTNQALLGHEKVSSPASKGCHLRMSHDQPHHRRRLSFSVPSHQDVDEHLLNASTSSLIEIVCSSDYDDDILDTWNEIPSPLREIPGGARLLPPSTAPATPEELLQAAEIAASMLLGREVMLPVLRDCRDYVPLDLQPEVPQIFANHSQGRTVYLTPSPALGRIGVSVVEATIEHVDHTDAKCLENWWEHDKTLSYASKEWHDWWKQNCAQVDPGCDMVKLVVSRDHYCLIEGHETVCVLQKGTILGMAHFARRINDPHNHHERTVNPSTLSMIRGIRVAPFFNAEALQRFSLCSDVDIPYYTDTCIRGIAWALLCHVLFTSVRCCNVGVVATALKSERAERFYQTHFGLPIGMEDDGKRIYRAMEPRVLEVLRHAFARHVKMWVRSLPPHRGPIRVLRELVPTQVASIQDQQEKARGKRVLPNETYSIAETGSPKGRSFPWSENHPSQLPDDAVSSHLKFQSSGPKRIRLPSPQPDTIQPATICFWEGGKKKIIVEGDETEDEEEGEDKAADDGGSEMGVTPAPNENGNHGVPPAIGEANSHAAAPASAC